MSKATFKRRCYGYTRVSTVRQGEGDSLESQRRAVELIAELEGYDLIEVFSDAAASGGTPLAHRPEGARLLSQVAPGDVIVCVKLDRLSRDALDAAQVLKTLKKQGVGLFLRDLGGDVTASNVSALIFGLLSNVAEFERSRIRERVADAKRSQKREGRYLGGGIPFGFTPVGDGTKVYLTADEALQTEAHKLRSQGYSARMAAGALTALGHPVTHKSVLRLWKQNADSAVLADAREHSIPQRQLRRDV